MRLRDIRLLSLLSLVMLFGCSELGDSDGDSDSDGTAPQITSFSASSTSITEVGQPVTLSWTTSGIETSLSLQPTSTGATTVTDFSSYVVYPTADTSYTLTASNDAGSVSSSVTVTISSSGTPPPTDPPPGDPPPGDPPPGDPPPGDPPPTDPPPTDPPPGDPPSDNEEPVAEIDVEGGTAFTFSDLLTPRSVTLSGVDSTDEEDDAEGKSLSYQWRVATAPEGSSAQPARVGGNAAIVTFTPDKIGRYRLVLRVIDSDGASDETPQTINVAIPSLSVSGETTVIRGTSQAYTLSIDGVTVSQDVTSWSLSEGTNTGTLTDSANNGVTYNAPNTSTNVELAVEINSQYIASGSSITESVDITVP